MRRLLLLSWCAVAAAGCTLPPPAAAGDPPTSTFSIVAYDPATKELGIAVQSKFLGVGAVVPFAKAGVGAVATQSWANTTYGPRGLELMAGGKSAAETLQLLTAADPGAARRQVGIVDGQGRVASFTGSECMAWAGGRQGRHWCAQGNILAGEQVVIAMGKAFEAATGDLGDRLIAALLAGQAAGGDKRGQQSAALLVVKANGGYAGLNDRYRDIRVDDHEQPIVELERIYALHKRVFRARTRRQRR